MTAPLLDEQALRRPAWTEGTPVVLCDGQTWHLPSPPLDGWEFRRDPGGPTYLARSFAGDYARLVDAYFASGDGVGTALALADMAYHLLALNYDLTFEQCRPLLRRYLSDDDPRAAANEAMWGAVKDAALGLAPKPTPVG